MLWLGTTAAVAQNIDLDDQAARQEETVTFTVFISTAPNEVTAFGLEITFDPSVLSFDTTDTNSDLIADAATPGPLVEGWTFFGVSSPASGRIRVGGSTITNGIAAGASGVLLQLTFTVVGDGDPASTTLAIVRPRDDVTTWTLGQGEFTFISDVPPLDIMPGAQTPPDDITITAPVENLPVLQLQLDSGADTTTINTVTVTFSDFTGDASRIAPLRVKVVNDTTDNGEVDSGEPVLANALIDPETESVTLNLTPPLVMPPNSTVHLLIALNVSTATATAGAAAAAVPPPLSKPYTRLAWLGILPPVLGIVLCVRLHRPVWLLAGLLGLALGCSVALTGCGSGSGDADAAAPFAFAVGIPVNGVTGQGAVFGPFTAPAAPIAGPMITVSP
jgi:hypothetical protein